MKIVGWASVGALAGAMATVSLQTMARGPAAPALPLEELQQLAAVYGLIKSDYVEPTDDKKLITDAISGMVSGLDPHSQYFDKKSFSEFREGTTGRFVGVGIEITSEDGLIRIVSPIEGSPAGTLAVPLNSMCSSTWATPVVPSTSSMAPTRSHTMCTAVGARWSGCTMSCMPFLSVNCCAPEAVADGALEG